MPTRFIVTAIDATDRDNKIRNLGVESAGVIWQRDTNVFYLFDPDANAFVAIGTGNNVAALNLPSGDIIVGDGTNLGAAVAPSGVLTMTNAGVFAFAAGQVKTVSVALSAANIIALNSAPKVIVAAPAAGTALIPLSMLFSMTYNSVQFTGGGVCQLQYHTKSANLMSSTVLDTSIKAAASFAAAFGTAQTASGLVVFGALALELAAASADFAAGNSTAKVVLTYLEAVL